MDKDFKFNHEKYYDPTAYRALSNVQKGGIQNIRESTFIWSLKYRW